MSLSAKFGALVVAAALLAQPAAALAFCGQGPAAAGDCPGGCPMPPSAPVSPVQAQGDDSSCCEISSTEPVPAATLAKSLEARAPLAVPALPAVASAEVVAAPAPVPGSPPRAVASSLHTLLCVFLI